VEPSLSRNAPDENLKHLIDGTTQEVRGFPTCRRILPGEIGHPARGALLPLQKTGASTSATVDFASLTDILAARQRRRGDE